MGLVGNLLLALTELEQRLSTTLLIFTGAATLLLSWRIWRFTIEPMMKPTEPRELPYWLPCEQAISTCSFSSNQLITIVVFGDLLGLKSLEFRTDNINCVIGHIKAFFQDAEALQKYGRYKPLQRQGFILSLLIPKQIIFQQYP